MPERTSRPKLVIRNAVAADIPAICDLVNAAYDDMGGYTHGMLQGQISAFPEGQFVVEYEGDVVGYAASFLIKEAVGLKPHSWREITGGGGGPRPHPPGGWV